ncbi:MAG: RNA polymerase factor sigma-54 [Pseudomonadota bacterium]
MNLQISQRMSHGLTMTGQMQQAISLLQFSNLDLQRYIEREAEENPFIETDRPGPALPFSGGGGGTDEFLGQVPDHAASLVVHVSRQFDSLFPDPARRAAADHFLTALDSNGWLDDPLEEIAVAAGLSLADAEEMLAEVQGVEPTGLFARDLSECLRLQAIERGLLSPLLARLLGELPRVAAADLEGLCRACSCSMAELSGALRSLKTLEPKPGARFAEVDLSEREPDLILSRAAGDWQVELNRSTLPAVMIDEAGADVMRRHEAAADFACERLRTARWLRRAVEHRNKTTLAVAAEIVRRQKAFLDHGPARIAPLTLADVAETVGVHESTVSRVTTGVLMVTPHGTMPLKRFFSTALAQASGETGDATSAAAVRYRLEALVRAEDPARPLSDDALARMLNDGGPILARRTVAKYRTMLGIPSSFERRRRARLRAA